MATRLMRLSQSPPRSHFFSPNTGKERVMTRRSRWGARASSLTRACLRSGLKNGTQRRRPTRPTVWLLLMTPTEAASPTRIPTRAKSRSLKRLRTATQTRSDHFWAGKRRMTSKSHQKLLLAASPSKLNRSPLITTRNQRRTLRRIRITRQIKKWQSKNKTIWSRADLSLRKLQGTQQSQVIKKKPSSHRPRNPNHLSLLCLRMTLSHRWIRGKWIWGPLNPGLLICMVRCTPMVQTGLDLNNRIRTSQSSLAQLKVTLMPEKVQKLPYQQQIKWYQLILIINKWMMYQTHWTSIFKKFHRRRETQLKTKRKESRRLTRRWSQIRFHSICKWTTTLMAMNTGKLTIF